MSADSPTQFLDDLGLDTSRPGFYDDPRFVAEEANQPALLELYACFIRAKRYDSDYLDRAERVIGKAATFLQTRLAETVQVGKCIDASMVLMRFLEKQGIWSYTAQGGLTAFLAMGTGIQPARFAPIMKKGNPALTGHAWLYAPPFVVVDVTVKLQQYRHGEEEFMPSHVLAKHAEPCLFDVYDLVDADGIEAFVQLNGREPTLGDIESSQPGILEGIERFRSVEIACDAARLRYVPIGVSAPSEPLEEWKNLQIQGKYPLQLYDEFVMELAGS